ncbi:MAG: HlyD family type I secretion periplasmic adaptor subunit [Alphaproteobacteria bacterium]|jgi:HlyD family secretion protein|nr:HlyD family type I secretion periplasmic adaptor subunit [Alphaproteobacteria bacterium]MDP7229613.1 HlyD family type I secretion periplasmic adaptor subunit [Alphaproteobacteria bacterium]MDP7462460.1 HlyD family type I secretion periplasmic adaptor subunit [Alphaproteobacteria bacterium]HJM92970.1 HlyD family type I secretion periplasmic adaptor subunit [Alphaproteobacteria bacterium]|tara:strand:- start:429 stop:2141 length:1713 start_codon:yes stop_codon:yes gene_type:complete
MSDDRTLTGGEYLFREGESADYGYVVKTGTIEIVKSGIDGEMILAELEAGSLFGEMALIDGNPRSAGARAKVDSSVNEIRSDTFDEYIRNNTDAALRLMKTLAGQLRTANNELAHVNHNLEIETTLQDTDSSGERYSDSEIEDTDAIYDRPPSQLVMYISVLVFLLFIGSLLFSYFTHIDTTVSARGKFTTKTPNVSVQATANSVVKALFIERGQLIKAGQIIALLDDTIPKTNLKRNKEKLKVVEGRLARIRWENKILNQGGSLADNINLDALNHDILTKRLLEYRSRIRSFSSKKNKLKQEIKSNRKTVEIVEEKKSLKAKLEDVQKGLYERKIGSLLKYLTAMDATLSARQSALVVRNSLKTFKSELNSIRADEKAFVAQWASSLAEKIAADEESRLELIQENVMARQQVKNVEVRAPTTGIILDLPKVSEGSIVREGDEILTLVQINQPLSLEVDIDPRDVSDTKVGMFVSVKLDALPFQKYGDLKGSLAFLSQDTFTESLSGEKGAFYRGRIEILSNQLQKLPPEFQLTQGMLASADILAGERNLITYFTFPITRAFEDAFREPD